MREHSCDDFPMTSDVHHRGARRAARACLLIGALAAVAVACGDERGGDAERFCGEVDANKAALTDPQLEFADDIEPYIDLYRSIGEVAPLSIEAEWNQLIVNYETVSTVVLGDTESEQTAVVSALQSEKAAATVSSWLAENCAVDLGPLATLVEHGG
jgi:hypothetical protein